MTFKFLQNLQSDFEKKKLSVQELERQRQEVQKQLDELDKEVSKQGLLRNLLKTDRSRKQTCRID
jgi:chaperonin cofactor prefoldin